MAGKSKHQYRSAFGMVLVLLLLLAPTALGSPPGTESFRQQADRAAQLEHRGLWQQAADVYEKLIHDGLPHTGQALRRVRDHYQVCLRHIYLVRRSQDESFRRQVLSRDTEVALKIYNEVLHKISDTYVDRTKAELTRLFQKGVEEFRLALGEPLFIRANIPSGRTAELHAFRRWLAVHWQDRVIHNRSEALAGAKEIALAAQRQLGLRPTAVILEFACGACNSLDEYTLYLTPAQLADIYASLRGETISIGASVVLDHQKILVAQVIPGSPAAMAMPPLREHDQILRIDGKPVDNLSAEAVDERLKGETGATVQLEVMTFGDPAPHTLVLTRQPVLTPSVQSVRMIDDDLKVGYFQLTGFQDTTLDEVDRALALLRAQGMRVLVLDLRGNPGGLFPMAIQVAERFLSEGVIVTTEGRTPAQNRKYEANNLTALSIPIVLLVDADTASAAEILAGALKDNHRARLVGQTTYGKGCIQTVIKLDTVPAGLRITLARFLSPRGHRYSDCGVVPDLLVERNRDSNFDEQFHAALEVARTAATLGP